MTMIDKFFAGIFNVVVEYPVKLILFVLGFAWFFYPLRTFSEGDEYDHRGRPLRDEDIRSATEDLKVCWLTSLAGAVVIAVIAWYLLGARSSRFWDAIIIIGGPLAAWGTIGMAVACSNFKWTEDVDFWKRAKIREATERE